jgi:phenylacetate-CoA ligase
MIPGKGIYDSLPVWAQTLAVNLASRRNFQDKYGPGFQRYLAQLEANEKKSLDQLEAEQQQALHELLRYAVAYVPFYRDQRLPPDDFAAWPILDKQTVAASSGSFLSNEFDPRLLMTINTSGTTGTPLTVRFAKEYHQMEMAFRWRHKAWAGCPYLSSGAYIAGHPVVPPNQKRPPFWRVDRSERRLLCSSYHLMPENLQSYVDAIREYGPDFVHGYPSSLYLLAKHMLDHGVTTLRPRAVFTASETLLDFQRLAIEQAFGTKVFNWYGNTEFTGNIIECEAGRLHQRLDYGLLELLNDGMMITTGLNNRAMPLIRYKVGDSATRQDGACPCGCAFPLIERIEGRIEDFVHTPDGRLVGRLDHVFKDVQHVREAQIVQTKIDELVLRIVRTNGFGPKDECIMINEARMRLGDSMRIRFEFTEVIERTAAGKFRFIVSQLPSNQREGERGPYTRNLGLEW